MPQVIPFIVAAVVVGTSVYGAVAGADARSAAEKNQQELLAAQKAALAKQGIVTDLQRQLLSQEIDAGALSVFADHSQQTRTQTPAKAAIASAPKTDISSLLTLGGIAVVGYVGLKALHK